jgi:hypothetical protein
MKQARAWRVLVLLGVLALILFHPLIGFIVIAGVLLRWPLRIFVESIIVGLAGGLSARVTGVFNSPQRAEKAREKFIERRERRSLPRRLSRSEALRIFCEGDDEGGLEP